MTESEVKMNLEMFHTQLQILWQEILKVPTFVWDEIHSPVGIAAVGSFFGAVGGYIMVMVDNRRKEIFSKVGHIKIAATMTFSLWNVFLGLKKQHIKELCKRYEASKQEFLKAKMNTTKKAGEIRLLFDFQSISFPYVDFGLINTRFFEKTDISGRAFALATTLVSTMYEFRNQIAYRHEVINEINKLRAEFGLNDHDGACLYFGVPFHHPALGDIQYNNYLR